MLYNFLTPIPLGIDNNMCYISTQSCRLNFWCCTPDICTLHLRMTILADIILPQMHKELFKAADIHTNIIQ
jgi:hypothetical protein